MIDQILSLTMGVFQSLDMISLIAALVILLLLGLAMQGYASVLNMTVLALLLLVIINGARSVIGFQTEQRAIDTLPQYYWDTAMAMTFGQFLIYFVAFAIVLSVVYIVKSVARR